MEENFRPTSAVFFNLKKKPERPSRSPESSTCWAAWHQHRWAVGLRHWGDVRQDRRQHSPSGHDEAQLAHAVQQRRGLLEERRHLGVLVHGTLHRQEAAVQLVDQAHVYHVAGKINKTGEIHFYFLHNLCENTTGKQKAFSVHTTTPESRYLT